MYLDNTTKLIIVGGLIGICALIFSATNAQNERDEWDLKCQAAGGMTVKQAQKRVCVKATYIPL